MTDNAFLRDERAKALYETVAAPLPVVDFHNHLSVKDIAENRRFTDPADLWIAPDPYKHRAMRMAGVPEALITGPASSEEKFAAWCGVFPELIGNPLYQWSLSELRSVFGIEEVPSRENAQSIRKKAEMFLEENEVTPAWFIRRFQVEKLCPCFGVWEGIPDWDPKGAVVPSLRADDALLPDPVRLAGSSCRTAEDYLAVLDERVAEFYAAGCRFSDHALDEGFLYYEDDGKNAARFSAIRSGETLPAQDAARFSSFVLTHLLSSYARRGMTVQLHLGALRRTSTRLLRLAGKAGGFASAGNPFDVASLARLFDAAEREGALPRVILFPLDPEDSARLSTLSGSFSADGTPGLITLGPAWWWNDHRRGMTRVLEEAAAGGLLSNFIGMTTDSRSFLSLVRHDSFRRVLCSYLSRLDGENALLADEKEIGRLIRRICYENAANRFKGEMKHENI